MFVAIWLSYFPRRIWTPALILLLAAGSIRTFTYVRRWNDPLSFYEYSLHVHPKSERIAMLVMQQYINAQRYDEARKIGEKAREYMPGYQDIWRSAGLVEEYAGDYGKAWEYYTRAQNLRASIDLSNHMPEVYALWIKQQAATRK
jgi:tetratricopeptide (TPR) repeat protein